MTVTVFGYLTLINIDSYDFVSPSVFSIVLVSTEKIYETLETMFDRITKHLEVRQRYSATRRFFNFLFGVWKCSHTWSFLFDILPTYGLQCWHAYLH